MTRFAVLSVVLFIAILVAVQRHKARQRALAGPQGTRPVLAAPHAQLRHAEALKRAVADPAVAAALGRQAAQLGQTMALRGLAWPDGTAYLTDGHAIVALSRTAVALSWPGLDPTWLGYQFLGQTFVAAYIAVTDPVTADRSVDTLSAMVGL